jgi:hypothetical protein
VTKAEKDEKGTTSHISFLSVDEMLFSAFFLISGEIGRRQ